jgi:hypothetical protein
MGINLKSITTRLGYERITGLSTPKGLNVPQKDLNGLNAKPVIAIIMAEYQDVRWRDDDVDPTLYVGMPLPVGMVLQYDGDLSKIKFIETAGGAVLNVCYYS